MSWGGWGPIMVNGKELPNHPQMPGGWRPPTPTPEEGVTDASIRLTVTRIEASIALMETQLAIAKTNLTDLNVLLKIKGVN